MSLDWEKKGLNKFSNFLNVTLCFFYYNLNYSIVTHTTMNSSPITKSGH